MAMRLDFNGLCQYVRQWIKDTAKIEMDEPLTERFVNMAYLETAYRAGWKAEFVDVTLVEGQGEYTLASLGISDMIRPKLVLFNGKKIKDTDHESMAALGYFDTDATSGEPDAVTFQTGNMTIRPKPDAEAAAGTMKILYTAAPAELTANSSLDDKFRTCWQETIAWLVLLKYATLPKEEDTRALFMSPDQIKSECEKRLQMMEKDVWMTAVSARKLKDGSRDKDEAYRRNNFYTN